MYLSTASGFTGQQTGTWRLSDLTRRADLIASLSHPFFHLSLVVTQGAQEGPQPCPFDRQVNWCSESSMPSQVPISRKWQSRSLRAGFLGLDKGSGWASRPHGALDSSPTSRQWKHLIMTHWTHNRVRSRNGCKRTEDRTCPRRKNTVGHWRQGFRSLGWSPQEWEQHMSERNLSLEKVHEGPERSNVQCWPMQKNGSKVQTREWWDKWSDDKGGDLNPGKGSSRSLVLHQGPAPVSVGKKHWGS